MRLMALLASLLLFLAACSDDNGTTPGKDLALDRAPVQDIGEPDAAKPDAAADAGKPDAAQDAATVEAGGDADKSDAQADANKPDGPKVDSGPLADKGSDIKLDAGNPLIYGTISRSVLPVNDGIGNLHISVSQNIFPFPPIAVASKVIKRADLSKAGSKINYQLNATVAAGTYTVAAWMDDNNNSWSPLAMAAVGDLIMSKGISTKVGTTAVKVDMVLDKVSQLGLGDAGVSGSALKGKVSAKVVPSGDGKGRLIFSLHTAVPPAGIEASGATILEGGDLSTPFQTEAYYFPGVKAGKYYLRAFLDDNGNAVGLLGVGNPDKGDMITSKPVQVHVVNGQVTTRDVVLDALQK